MKLLLIRHGESVGNAEHRLQGQADFALTERGQAQAHALARRLQGEGWALAAVYSSDLRRATETAQILAAHLDLPLTLDARLREHHVGVLTGIVWQEIESRYPELWTGLHSAEWAPIPEGEKSEAFHARLAATLTDIQARHEDGEAVAVVSHGGSLGMMLVHLLGLDPQRPIPFHFGNASLSIVELGSRGPRLSLLNDTSHLTGDQ